MARLENLSEKWTMKNDTFPIDILIEVVVQGGTVKTGVDVYNGQGILLLDKDTPVSQVSTLLKVKQAGVIEVPINQNNAGGVWDQNGNPIVPGRARSRPGSPLLPQRRPAAGLEARIAEIITIKKEAARKYQKAKETIATAFSHIRERDGEFDAEPVREMVTEIFNFLTTHESAFSYLTHEIFTYDEYLFNHAVNVCAIGITALKKFNVQFSDIINNHLETMPVSAPGGEANLSAGFVYYLPEELHDIALGYFLHDIGKTMIPEKILNKKGKLSPSEFDLVKTHSYQQGTALLARNGITSPYICNSVTYHHARLYSAESNCYPHERPPAEIPPYAKVCKLADIYDAMTSKRAYKEALNPIMAVTDLFRKYAQKDRVLQFILHSFVKAVGIYPPGSIVYLLNGQMAYIIDSKGPLVIPFTDSSGRTLAARPDPVNLGDPEARDTPLQIEKRKPLTSPIEAFDLLPAYIRSLIKNEL